jgi:hypothetical protein
MGRPCAPSVGPIRAPRRVHSTPQTGTSVPVSGRPRSPGHQNWLVTMASHQPALASFLAGLRAGRVLGGTGTARTRRRATGAARPPGAEGARVRESTFETLDIGIVYVGKVPATVCTVDPRAPPTHVDPALVVRPVRGRAAMASGGSDLTAVQRTLGLPGGPSAAPLSGRPNGASTGRPGPSPRLGCGRGDRGRVDVRCFGIAAPGKTALPSPGSASGRPRMPTGIRSGGDRTALLCAVSPARTPYVKMT